MKQYEFRLNVILHVEDDNRKLDDPAFYEAMHNTFGKVIKKYEVKNAPGEISIRRHFPLKKDV